MQVSKNKTLMYKLASASVFLYIISAIAFEMSAETAIISTLAIYLVFAIGFFYLIQRNHMVINEYVGLSVLFCVYVLFRSMSQSASVSMGLQIAYWEFTCVILCLLIFWMVIKYPDMVSVILFAYIAGALILAFRVVSEYGGVRSMIDFASMDGENRIGGLLGNTNAIGLFFANGVFCSMVFFIKHKKPMVKFAIIVVLIALATMLLLSGSRKSTIFMLAGFILFYLLYYRKDKSSKKISMGLLAIVVLVIVFYLIRTLPMFSTIYERFELLFKGFVGGGSNYKTDETRKAMISIGFSAFMKKPLMGYGTGYSYRLFGTYSHNNFVELLMNYGIVGFTIYYMTYVLLLAKIFRRVLKKDIYAIYFFVYISMQLAMGIGWVNYYDRPTQLITALAFGYLINVEKNERIFSNENIKSV